MAGSSYRSFMNGLADGMFAVMNLSLAPPDQLIYSTFLGGSGLDAVTGMVLDGNGGVWLTGYTMSNDFPVTQNAYQTAFTGYADAWVAHLDLSKTAPDSLTYSSLYNGTASSYGDFPITVPYAIILDSQGRPTIGGYTSSVDLPVVAPLSISQTSLGLPAFLVTLDPAVSGNAGVVFSSTFGGVGQNSVVCLTKDTSGKILVGGFTTASSFPVTDGSVKSNPAGAITGFYMLIEPDPTATIVTGARDRGQSPARPAQASLVLSGNERKR